MFYVQPQPAWSQEAQVAVWRGSAQSNRDVMTLPGLSILSAEAFKNSLLMITNRNGSAFLLQLDSKLAIINNFPLNIPAHSLQNVEWKFSENNALVLVGNTLFSVSRNFTKISDNAFDAVFLHDESIAFLEKNGNRNLVKFFKNGSVTGAIELKSGRELSLASFENTVVSLQTLGAVTALEFSEPGRPNYVSWRIPAQREFCFFKKVNNHTEIVFLQKNSGQYEVAFAPVSNVNAPRRAVPLPLNLIEPMLLKETGGTIFVLFRNGLVTLDGDGEILSEDYIRAGEWFKTSIPDAVFNKDSLILSTQERSIIIHSEEQQFWFVHRFLQTSGRYIILIILLAVSLWLLKKYLRQRDILHAVVDLPATGIVIFIDKKQRLVRANSAAKKLLKITQKVPLKRNFRYYCQQESCNELIGFVESSLTAQAQVRKKITLKDGAASEEIVFTALPLHTFSGVFRGLIITGTNITEELEKKRLVNWAQLAHDMQTNLSVIRLNAEQFSGEDEGNIARRKKILFQISLIMQRVRDLVTVGRTDTIEVFTVNARELCHDVLQEFDEQMFPHVEFLVEAENFMFGCDKHKIIRALRNATENAVRALKGKQGQVTLKAWREGKNICLSVRDTGAGMNEEVKRNMFTPYFTTGQHQGGTGIGTMIMQHVVHLHNGEIIVDSEINRGTQVIFKIPAEIHHRANGTPSRVKNTVKNE